MHREAYEFVAQELDRMPASPDAEVVEIGGRNINGSIRSLFGRNYTSTDIAPGEGVDVVASGADYQHPKPIDVAVCCEVLEHTPDVEAIIANLARQLSPTGRLILTAAGPTRTPHSAIDGADLHAGEYYGNVEPERLQKALEAAGIHARVELGRFGQDVYAVAYKQAESVPTAERLRILLVHPGASISTHDVYTGLEAGLKALGHTVYAYNLDERIERSGRWLDYCWRKGGKAVEKPQPPDVLLHAGGELVTRALRIQPDVVLIVSSMFLHPDVLVLLRRAYQRVAMLLTESPYDDERQARLLPWVDVAWTNERTSARQMGIKYLPHAWNHAVHQAHKDEPDHVPSHDVVFVGTPFQERVDLLSAVDWTGIDLGLYGGWGTLPPRHRLRKYIKGSYIKNEHAAALYRKAKIGLNLYRTSKGFGKDAPRIAHAESLNPRAYELAALGCFTLSDARAEVTETFGDLVPTFSDAGGLCVLMNRWLSDDAGRQRIQAQLPSAVAGHTWLARAGTVVSDLLDAGIVARRGAFAGRSADLARVVGG